MNLVPASVRITSDTLISSAANPQALKKPVRVFCVNLISGVAASTLILRDGTDASGTAFEQIDGTATQSATKNYAGGLRFPNGCFADVDANISYATISFTEEF